MVNKKICLGVLLITWTFPLSFFGCADSVDKELNGTWMAGVPDGKEPTIIIQYEDGIFELLLDGFSCIKGTYTTKGNKLTRKGTHIGHYYLVLTYGVNEKNLGSKWFTLDELVALLHIDDFDISLYSENLAAVTITYSISGDTLTEIYEDGNSYTNTRISRGTDIVRVADNSSRNSGDLGSNSNQAFVGRWVEVKYGTEMDLLSDGTGVFDHQTVTWKLEGNRLYILAASSFGDSFGDNGSFEYKMTGSVLNLIYRNGDSETFVKRN